jgi:hypothetical protein
LHTRHTFVVTIGDMTTTRRIHALLFVLVALACSVAGAAGARAGTAAVLVTLRPVEDVSFPFWCDWGYEWQERCWWDDGIRLPVGGDADKVWRAGLRFSLATIPAGATVVDASLTVRHDAVCLGPRKTTRPCAARDYTIDLHPIFTESWFSEREVEIGEFCASVTLPLATRPEWLSWDVTGLVESWLAGEPNHGLLLKLADGQEDFAVGGPAFPSSAHPEGSIRPRLEVYYLPPAG